MTAKLKKDLADFLSKARFRANQEYELVLFDRLTSGEQEMFGDLQKQANFYGILRPSESSGLSVKSVSQDTALLYLSLREPGMLPGYARTLGGQNFATAIAKFVIDQVLEIESDGEFVSGAKAYELFYGTSTSKEARTRIGQLSTDALRYGQALSVTDISELSMRLYHYHGIPVSVRWQERLERPEKVAELLGVGPKGQHSRILRTHWQVTPTQRNKDSKNGANGHHHEHEVGNPRAESENFVSWLSWVSRKSQPQTSKTKSTFKLYISPLPEFISEVFGIAFNTLAKTNAFHMKVGADAQGLLRPDKMVAYFSTQEDLREASQALAKDLDGCPPHGVPFTAEISGDGLLSWGVDPPETKQLLSWKPQESWRLWLTNRLANALLSAGNSRADESGGLEPWQYAMERLSLEGVDTESWTPAQKLWH